jgi:hypothetical protein
MSHGRGLGVAAAVAVFVTTGCAGLGMGTVVQAPRFEVAEGRQAEFRLSGPTSQLPAGGVTVRLWARVQNPNSFGFTLASVAGNLFLEQAQSAAVNLPLGLPLQASQDTVIPLDITLSFAEVPRLADVLLRAVTGGTVAYRLDGTVGVEAGPFGRPSFGPSTLLQGNARVFQ